MKRLLTALLGLLLILVLCACGRDPAGSTPNGGPGSAPSAVQSENRDETNLPSRRPAHNLESLDKIVGWHEITYREGTKYPSRVTTTDLDGVVKQIYELVFDKNGVPYKLNVRDNHGELKSAKVGLSCDEQGNISEVSTYNEDGQITSSFQLTYNEEGRMVTTTQIKGQQSLELTYDERFCITNAVIRNGSDVQEVELGYDRNYQVIKRLVRDGRGTVISGFEEIRDASGILREYHTYKDGVIAQEKKYNEKGLMIEELSRSADGKKVMQIIQNYDSQDRVTKISLLENGKTAGWTDIAYDGMTSTALSYDVDGKYSQKSYVEFDEKDRILKRLVSDSNGQILESCEYAYNEKDIKTKSIEYSYKADGTLIRGEERRYDDQGREISHFRYNQNGLYSGRECQWHESGNKLWEKSYGYSGGYTVKEYLPGKTLVHKSTSYNADGQITSSVVNEYDENDCRRKTTSCGKDGTKKVTIYNDQSDLIERTLYDAEGKVTERTMNTYNDAGKRATVTIYGPDNEIVERTEYTYNEAGKTSMVVNYGAGGKLTEYTKYVYNADGKQQTITTYGADDQIISRKEYTYYASGNIKSIITYGPSGEIIRERHYEEEYQLQG